MEIGNNKGPGSGDPQGDSVDDIQAIRFEPCTCKVGARLALEPLITFRKKKGPEELKLPTAALIALRLEWSAASLPKGLQVDRRTGLIHGVIAEAQPTRAYGISASQPESKLGWTAQVFIGAKDPAKILMETTKSAIAKTAVVPIIQPQSPDVENLDPGLNTF